MQDLVARWWFNYDEGNFNVLEGLLTDDVHFSCRTDSGATDYEEFVRADYRGRDAVMAWQTDHRLHSPYPLRHNGTNVHIVEQRGDEATFASYIAVIADRRWRVAALDRDRQRSGPAATGTRSASPNSRSCSTPWSPTLQRAVSSTRGKRHGGG